MVVAQDTKHLAAFDARAALDDGYGNPVSGDWVEQFQRWASFTNDGGSEAVIAARLEGRNILRVRLRSDSQTRTITTDFRVRDVHRGTAYAVIHADSVTDPEWVWLRIESGVAA